MRDEKEKCNILLIGALIFTFGIIIGFVIMLQFKVNAEQKANILQEEVNLLQNIVQNY
jgi:uncharacterized membrane-anchored protein YhcB (DUF1043 family)